MALPVLHLFQIQNCPLFLGLKHMWGQIFKLIKYIFYFIFHIYLYILLILACVFGGCSLWWGKVVIPVDTQRVHHFSTAGLGDMMNHVYLQELQSGPSSVASSTHSMLRWVTPLWYYCTITTKGFTSQSSLLFPATFTLCFVKSHFRVEYLYL